MEKKLQNSLVAYFEDKKNDVRRQLRNNKVKINILANEQRLLKKAHNEYNKMLKSLNTNK